MLYKTKGEIKPFIIIEKEGLTPSLLDQQVLPDLTKGDLCSNSRFLNCYRCWNYFITAVAAWITLCTVRNHRKVLSGNHLTRHYEAPPTTGCKFLGSKIAAKNGAIVKQPLTFELYGFWPCLNMI